MSVEAPFEYVTFLSQNFSFLIRHCVLVYGDVSCFIFVQDFKFLTLVTKLDYIFLKKESYKICINTNAF